MAKGIMVVQSAPIDPAREDEYNEWYSQVHLPEVVAMPGFVGATRYKVHDSSADSATHSYLAIYEIEADDIAGPIAEMRARSAAGETQRADVLRTDPPAVVTVYELIQDVRA